MSAQILAITRNELQALHGAGPLAVAVYLHLRAWMDYGTGIVGKSRPVSLAMLAAFTETHTPRGSGTQIEQPTEKAIRTALDRLNRAGLLHRLGAERLLFRLPLALTVQARPNQTRHGDGTLLSPEPDTAEAAPALAMQAEPGTESEGAEGPNPAHIMYQVNQTPPRPPVHNSGRAWTQQPTRASRAPSEDRPRLSGSSHDQLTRYAARLGITARPGESWQEFGARVRMSARGMQA